MPEREHRRYQRWARQSIHSRKGPNGKVYGSVQEHRNAAVFGRLRKQGWKPKKRKAAPA